MKDTVVIFCFLKKNLILLLKYIILIIFPVYITILVKNFLSERVKLIVYYIQPMFFKIEKREDLKGCDLSTQYIEIVNSGKIECTNVTIAHNYLPDDISINPTHISYKRDCKQKTLVFPKIIPDQRVTISYLFPPQILILPLIKEIYHDLGYAQSGDFVPIKRYNLAFRIGIYILLIYILICGLIVTSCLFTIFLY